MPKAFLFTNKRYDLYNLNIPQTWRTHQQFLRSNAVGDEKKDENGNGDNNGNFSSTSLEDVGVSNSKFLNNQEGEDDENVPQPFSRQEKEVEVLELEEPVNLSMKRINLDLDLFNLRQLADVSISIVPDSTSSTPTPPLQHAQRKLRNTTSSDSLTITAYNIPTQNYMSIDDEENNEGEDFSITESTCSSSGSGSGSSSSSIGGSSGNTSGGTSTSKYSHHHHHHQCIECGKGYSTLSNLLRHRQTHRSTTDSNAVKTCPYCDKVYVSMPAFSMHLRTHNQGCKCPYCGKLFSRPWLLQGHIRTHTGEKPFECPSCNKKFADKSNLRAHTQTHSTDKPYICSRCNKKFGLKSYLSKHIESSCMKTNKAPLPLATTTGKTNNGGRTSKTVDKGTGQKAATKRGKTNSPAFSSASSSSASSPISC